MPVRLHCTTTRRVWPSAMIYFRPAVQTRAAVSGTRALVSLITHHSPSAQTPSQSLCHYASLVDTPPSWRITFCFFLFHVPSPPSRSPCYSLL